MNLQNLWKRTIVAGLSLLAAVGIVRAAEPTADKSGYNLLNPTPRGQMREMTTDRPDKTESPFTVDAGHFQIEADLFSYSVDRHNAVRTDTRVESFSVAPVNLKAGLLNNLDLQIILPTYNSVRTDDRTTAPPTVTRQRGFGDVVTRIKWNFWGNDGGTTAFALMPYLKLPTNQEQLGNGSVEGGLIAPFAVKLPCGWDLGLMTQLDVVRDGGTSGYHPEFVNSITFSHDIVGKLGGYVEFFSSVSTERGSSWVGTVDVGFTYSLTENIQLDAGINLGLTRSADDVNPFVGITFRF